MANPLGKRSTLLLCAALCTFWYVDAEPPALARSYAESISALLARHPALARAQVGYLFADVTTGVTLAEQASNRFFTPASNAKLYTTACGLARLGPDYRFRTEVLAAAPWQVGVPELDELALIGGGDPNLSGRAVPYVRPPDTGDPSPGDPLQPFRDMAEQVWTAGVRRVRHGVTGVSVRYRNAQAIPDGWTVDDTTYSYGAPVSALVFNDSSVTLTLKPSRPGSLALVEMQPPVDHFLISNQVLTTAGDKALVEIRRPAGSNELILTGFIGAARDHWRDDVAVDDPALWSAEAFTSALQARGIAVMGGARASYGETSRTWLPLLTRASAPLSQTVQIVNKTSQNLHAELIGREMAAVLGPDAMNRCLAEAGVTSGVPAYVLEDGSGLARQDLLTPAGTVTLLRWMWSRPEREAFLSSLPVAGWDGSLQKRFRGVAGAHLLHAKTGSLSHVITLSGYIEGDALRPAIAFSVMLNGVTGSEADGRLFIDQLCSLFLPQ